jgi:hypothetical protein
MHFGLYLHRKGIITAEQLVAALEAQTRSLVRIGQLALEEGILSARDVFDVLRTQHRSPRERFGELAIEMRLMTREQLMRLLMIQADRRMPLEEILVRQGVLSQSQLNAEFNNFRASHAGPHHPISQPRSLRRPSMRKLRNTREEAWLAT